MPVGPSPGRNHNQDQLPYVSSKYYFSVVIGATGCSLQHRSDILVCWLHNWPECPLPVVELKTELNRLLMEGKL